MRSQEQGGTRERGREGEGPGALEHSTRRCHTPLPLPPTKRRKMGASGLARGETEEGEQSRRLQRVHVGACEVRPGLGSSFLGSSLGAAALTSSFFTSSFLGASFFTASFFASSFFTSSFFASSFLGASFLGGAGAAGALAGAAFASGALAGAAGALAGGVLGEESSSPSTFDSPFRNPSATSRPACRQTHRHTNAPQLACTSSERELPEREEARWGKEKRGCRGH
eukprot:1109353-Rhodomonas_salina.1